MRKIEILNRILETGVIAVVRAESAEQSIKIIDAAREGGILALEVTMTVPGAIDVIKEICQRYAGGEEIIGAGTVLDAETARVAMLAGAQFIVGPTLNPDMVRICNRYQINCMPGATSVREVLEALELGATIVKIFPGNLLKPDFIKAVHGPLPYAPLMPTGGVSVESAKEWIRAGAVAIGVGGDLTKEGIAKGDYSLITRKAETYIKAVREARSG
ncbi:MAG: bifunctional 4-hydroxy-2-oxoglutarate aldolase/2-dehydro-3-deoxy-phosphogluconate aldolase [Proteobacteria bacterium]|nr:bifunctional 4-hydroxy-2-oxoglutarate aldolase/2-dehydro-3-deoxy-phosphogluconate aldolase [Pseudomonadota bacterium]NIS72559.1 bifunctional 4-hydroxy-2-oxoglutarate aldolase/2-dehydro-3-deoxy-phosphogluconate aldolase [Pseudomonadota bacterium]